MTKDKRFVWFCTVFKKKNNRPLFTFDVMEWFTEWHALALCIMKWWIKDIEKDVYNSLKEYVNKTWEPSERAKKYIDDFEKIHRVMIKMNK